MKSALSLPSYLLCAALMLLPGCATHIKVDTTQNPPPKEKLSDFNHFEMNKVVLPAPYAGQAANEKAARKIDENILVKTSPMFVRWSHAAPSDAPVRTLVVTPRIAEVKFINVTSRVWAGPMAGSSAVVLKATLTEKETGKVIAEPVFYARAEAWGGAFTFGASDNLMLTRVANRLTDYLEANYKYPVGGPTGAQPGK